MSAFDKSCGKHCTNVVSFRPTGGYSAPRPPAGCYVLLQNFLVTSMGLSPNFVSPLWPIFGSRRCSSLWQSCTRAEYNSLRVCGPEILAGLPAMTTETMFLTVTRYQFRDTYVHGTLLVSTYLCFQKLTPIKG